MAFSKNWKQLVVSKGEPFQIEYLDRRFGGRPRVVFKVNDDTGAVEVDGVELTGTQNVAGDIVATGDVSAANVTASATVTGADLHATDDLTVGDDAAVGGDLAVTGTSTFTGLAKLPAASFLSVGHLGVAAAGPVTLTGAKVGDLVMSATQIGTTPADAKAKFETVITVADQIQQTSATNLSAEFILFILLHQS